MYWLVILPCAQTGNRQGVAIGRTVDLKTAVKTAFMHNMMGLVTLLYMPN